MKIELFVYADALEQGGVNTVVYGQWINRQLGNE